MNDEIDKLRLSATASLTERRDVVVVASVSCIYGLGSPDEYQGMMLSLRPGMAKDRDEVIHALIEMQYDRNDLDLDRGRFRVHGDVVDIHPAQGGDYLIRVEFSEMRLTALRRLIPSRIRSMPRSSTPPSFQRHIMLWHPSGSPRLVWTSRRK